MAATQIRLPSSFTTRHEQVVIDYLVGGLQGQSAWKLAFEAFDLLDEAVMVTPDGRYSFRALFLELVDHKLADDYLRELITLNHVKENSPALWSRYARQIAAECRQRNWREANFPYARILVSYFLYWWASFARGYAFEVEIFRDLQSNGIEFEAHDLLNRQSRYSASDLIINSMMGDIKTSVYFVQAATPLQHDFYIVRLFIQKRSHTLAVMLKPLAWEEINGDTVEGTLETVVTQFPSPVKIKQGRHELVGIEYSEWKRRILRLQEKPL